MPEELNLTVTLRKEVPDTETGEALVAIVKQKLIDHPEIKIAATITKRIPENVA